MKNPPVFRKANLADLPQILQIMEKARAGMIARGIHQWDGPYPAASDIEADIAREAGFILEDASEILAYGALLAEPEPAYEKIDGAWAGNGPYLVIHRVFAAPAAQGKGLGSLFFEEGEKLAREMGLSSIRVDTNHDNVPMLNFLGKRGYQYRGEVPIQGSPKKAFEKIFQE